MCQFLSPHSRFVYRGRYRLRDIPTYSVPFDKAGWYDLGDVQERWWHILICHQRDRFRPGMGQLDANTIGACCHLASMSRLDPHTRDPRQGIQQFGRVEAAMDQSTGVSQRLCTRTSTRPCFQGQRERLTVRSPRDLHDDRNERDLGWQRRCLLDPLYKGISTYVRWAPHRIERTFIIFQLGCHPRTKSVRDSIIEMSLLWGQIAFNLFPKPQVKHDIWSCIPDPTAVERWASKQ